MRYPAMLLFSALAGTSAVAQQARSPEQVTITGQQPPQQKKVCTRIVLTGSIMPQTICKTQDQIEYDRARSLTLIERLRNERTADQQLRVNRDARDSR